MLSALCINLGKGKNSRKEDERSSEINQFIRKVSNDCKLNVIFTQDTFSKRNIYKILKVLEETGKFDLKWKQFDGNSSDHVGIFIDTERFEVTNIESDQNKELEKFRKQDPDFFTETYRAIFVLITDKITQHTILLSSFHAKKNGITDIKREKHIIEFLKLLEGISQRTKSNHILGNQIISIRLLYVNSYF